MICPICKGGKTLLKKEQGKGCYEIVLGICDKCHGTGEIEMTNEEWFCGLSTEEKADFMSRVLGCSNCPIPKDGRSCMGTYSGCWHEIIKWLKQPHKE